MRGNNIVKHALGTGELVVRLLPWKHKRREVYLLVLHRDGKSLLHPVLFLELFYKV